MVTEVKQPQKIQIMVIVRIWSPLGMISWIGPWRLFALREVSHDYNIIVICCMKTFFQCIYTAFIADSGISKYLFNRETILLLPD